MRARARCKACQSLYLEAHVTYGLCPICHLTSFVQALQRDFQFPAAEWREVASYVGELNDQVSTQLADARLRAEGEGYVGV